jgi:hypothetical protein
MDAELKLTVTPVGWPLAVNAIDESNPPETVVVTVELPLPPSATETALGEAASVKEGVSGVLPDPEDEEPEEPQPPKPIATTAAAAKSAIGNREQFFIIISSSFRMLLDTLFQTPIRQPAAALRDSDETLRYSQFLLCSQNPGRRTGTNPGTWTFKALCRE